MTSWPDLAAIELLVAVADHGSLSAGARAVGMSQPNASRSLARLERRLRLSLVHRSTAGSTLTPSGLLVVGWCRAVVVSGQTLLNGAATLAVDNSDAFAVAASQTVAEHLLPGWLAEFRITHPAVRVAIHLHNTTGVLDEIVRGTATLGFIEGPHAPKGLNSAVVARDELVLVVDPGHRWARRRRPVTAQELTTTPLVTREPGSGTRVALDVALGQRVTPALELPSNAAVRVAVLSGAGPAVLSLLAVADQLAAGTLRQVPLDGLRLDRALRAVWAGPRHTVGPVADLVRIAQAGRRAQPATAASGFAR